MVKNDGVLDVVAGSALGNTIDTTVNGNNLPGLSGNVSKNVLAVNLECVGKINKKILVNKVRELILGELHCIILLLVHKLGVKGLTCVNSGKLSVVYLITGELLDKSCVCVVVNAVNALTGVGHKNVKSGLLAEVKVKVNLIGTATVSAAVSTAAEAGGDCEHAGKKHYYAKN